MLNSKKIGIIGSGNMGEALISGLVSSGSTPAENIICSDVRKERLEFIKDTYGIVTTTDNLEVVAASDIIVYSVKPQIMAAVLRQTADSLDMSKLIISVAAGVPMAAIESCLNKDLRLIRVMPNVAVAVKEGASAIAAGAHAWALGHRPPAHLLPVHQGASANDTESTEVVSLAQLPLQPNNLQLATAATY